MICNHRLAEEIALGIQNLILTSKDHPSRAIGTLDSRDVLLLADAYLEMKQRAERAEALADQLAAAIQESINSIGAYGLDPLPAEVNALAAWKEYKRES